MKRDRASLIAVTAIVVLVSLFSGYGLRGRVAPPATPTITQAPAAAPFGAVEPLAPGVPLREVSPIIPGYRFDLADAIITEADRAGLPRLLVLAMAHQEGGVRGEYDRYIGDLDLDPSGSCGPFQVYIAVHGGPCSKWYDPVVAMRYLERDRWLAAYYRLGGFLRWEADPPTALELMIPAFQGSIRWPAGLGAQAYAEAQRTEAGWQAEKAARGVGILPSDLYIVADGLIGAFDTGNPYAFAINIDCLRTLARYEVCQP